MGNKDEKTFADLFSGSTSEENKDEQQTFGTILSNENTEVESPVVMDDRNHEVTFDSIFDKLEEQDNTVHMNDDTKQNSTKKDFNEVIDENASMVNLNSLFQTNDFGDKDSVYKEKDNVKDKKNDDDSESTDGIAAVSKEEVVFSDKEDIVSEKHDNEKEISVPDLFSNPTSEPNNQIDFFEEQAKENEEVIEKNEVEKNSSPFFQTANKLEEENPFFANNSSEHVLRDDSLEKNEKENNNENDEVVTKEEKMSPFFQNDTQVEATTQNIVDIDSHNIFGNRSNEAMIREDDNGAVSNEEVHPFFQENSDLKKEKEIKEKKSTSPFFEETDELHQDTMNPFFQNQLSLVENKIPDNPKNGNLNLKNSKHYHVKIEKKKEPFIKFIFGVLSYALFIWLLLIGVTLLIYVLDIKIRAAKGDYSSPTFNAYVVLTGSMLPEIQINDVVITKKVDASELQEGDVITFASADKRFLGTIITHRIIKKNPPSGDETGYTFQTRGDNNNVADSALVPEKNIYGKVILKIPKLGYLQEFLASDGGWIIVILIPCLTVISYDTVKLIKGLKRRKYKNIKVQK